MSGNGPSAVTGQTGEMLRLVNWIQSSHEEIQNQWADWKFLWKEGSFSTIASQGTYDLTNTTHMGGAGNEITDFNTFSRFSEAEGSGPRIWIDNNPLLFVPWDEYRSGDYAGLTGTPYAFTIKPNDEWVLLPTPDAVVTVNFEYYRTPLVLVNNADAPLIPSRYHDAIIGRAMMKYGRYEDAAEIVEAGQERLSIAMDSLEADQLDRSEDMRFSTNTGIVVTPG